MSSEKFPIVDGGIIRAARKAIKPRLTTTELGRRIGLSNVAITRGERNDRNFSLQTIFDLAHELETDFGEPIVREHLNEWLSRMAQTWGFVPSRAVPPPQIEDFSQLVASLFDEKTLKQIPEEEIDDYLHVVKDAVKQVEAFLTERLKHRKKRK